MLAGFDGFTLDASNFELRHDGELVPVEPQVFEVLAHLVLHRDRLVTKEELLDSIWGSRFVSESALTSRIKSARQAIGDDGKAQRCIKTVHGRGYRFVAEVTEFDEASGGDAGGPGRRGPGDGAGRGRLPSERTPLFGRDADIEAVGSTLESHRLVSLLGIGGTGKTRLAAAAARAVADRFPDGVWYVDLVPVDDRAGIELAIADAAQLGLGASLDVIDQIAGFLVERDALFVVDNAEHVSADTAHVIDELLERTSAPRFLVTSRVPLGLPDERRLSIRPLSVDSLTVDAPRVVRDDVTTPAVELLMSAAERFGASVGDDRSLLADICRRLDGLPLAIELAAAQLRQLDPASLAERLDRRFEVLADQNRPGRERHSSLHAVLEDTLTDVDVGERELLQQMAAFPSWFALDDLTGVAAQRGTEAVEASLGGLVDRSLVVRYAQGSRYRLLETVKMFARSSCSDDERHAIERHHADWCLARVGTDAAAFQLDHALADWCFDHHDDLNAATRHLTNAGRPDDAARLTAATSLAMHADLGSRAASMLSRIDGHLLTIDDDALVTQLHLAAVMCGMATRSPERIAAHGRLAVESAERSGDPLLRSMSLVLQSWSVVFDDPETALRLTEEAATLGVAADHAGCRDLADGYRAFHLAMLRRYDEAQQLAHQVIQRVPDGERQNYSTHVATAALTCTACIHDPEVASPWADEVLGTPSARNSMWSNDLLAATIHASNGRADRAAAISLQIRDRLRQAGQDPFPDLLIPPAALAHRRGDTELAEALLQAVRVSQQPTQSFQATVLYRRLREAVGRPVPVDDDRPLDEVGAEALDWLRAAAR